MDWTCSQHRIDDNGEAFYSILIITTVKIIVINIVVVMNRRYIVRET
jgi:hypothetical protein